MLGVDRAAQGATSQPILIHEAIVRGPGRFEATARRAPRRVLDDAD